MASLAFLGIGGSVSRLIDKVTAPKIEPQSLRNSQKYRLIIAPWHLIGKKETCDRLRHFVEEGGTLLLETGFASYDDHMVYNPVVPSYGLAEVFGYREQESLFMMQDDEGRMSPKPDEMPASDRVYLEGQLSFMERISASIKIARTPRKSARIRPVGNG